jgi:mRNA interferase MazF
VEQRISPRQGEIWDVDFDPIRGHEQGGRRPALVVSHDRFNRNISALCLVVPLTTRLRGTTVEVHLNPPDGGLKSPSALLTNQIRSVSQERFLRKRGEVETATLESVLMVVRKFLTI